MKKILKISVAVVFALAMVATAKADTTPLSACETLRQGSSGPCVMTLQAALNANGASLVVDGSFGPMTNASVISYQTAHNLSADGVVGPLTKASLAGSPTTPPAGPLCPNGNPISNNCMPTTPTGPNNLEGSDGTVDAVTTISSYSDEEVGESANAVKVAGFEVETSSDGDVAIKSVKVTFDPTSNGAGDSDHLDDYIDSVAVWMGSTKVGSADVSAFTENSDDTSSKVISLSNAVVQSDDSEKFYISVDSVGNLDSGDIDSDDWSVGLENLRYIDGSGVVTTFDGADMDTGAGDIGYVSADDGIEINFVDFSTAADTELKVSIDTDSPETGIELVDDDSTTDVVLLMGHLKLDGDSDATIDELPFTLTVTGATDIDNVTGNLTLTLDGEDYTESVSTATETSATVTFDNLNFDMSAGDTIDFTITAEILELDGVSFDEGDTLLASLTSTNRGNIDAENEEGDQLTAGEKTGTATGDAQEFRTEGISVTLISAVGTKSASDTNDADTATFVIKFKVKANGDTMYIATTASTGGAINNTYTVTKSTTATTAGVSEAIQNNTDLDLSTGGNWAIEDDTEESFEMTILKSITAGGNDGLYKAALSSVKWNSDDDTSTYNSYTSDLDAFITGYVSLD